MPFIIRNEEASGSIPLRSTNQHGYGGRAECVVAGG